MQHILGTGLSGLVGSKLVKDFSHKYLFDQIDKRNPVHPVDITDMDSLQRVFDRSNADFVVHAAAYTDVTGAWKQSDDTSGSAYKINVIGTQNVIAACQKTNKHLIHISTAYVFDGEKETPYLETDQPNPIEWYGKTKMLAEEKIKQANNLDWTILRIDQPFRSDDGPRPDIVKKIVTNIKNDSLYPQFTDHFFSPTFIDDFAKVVDWVIRTKTTGLYHASSGEKISDFEFASLINQVHSLGGTIKAGSLDEYLKTIARPYQRNTSLNCQKLTSELDFKLNTLAEAIKKVQI